MDGKNSLIAAFNFNLISLNYGMNLKVRTTIVQKVTFPRAAINDH